MKIFDEILLEFVQSILIGLWNNLRNPMKLVNLNDLKKIVCVHFVLLVFSHLFF